jgi:hypothetical protein
MWKAMVERSAAALEAPEAAARVFTLRYEAFMHEPLALGEQVVRHLGAASSESFKKRLAEAHVASIGSFRKRNPQEIAAAERVAGDALARFGYQ